MTGRQKIFPLVLGVIGLVFFLYAVIGHSRPVLTENEDNVTFESEPRLVREVTIGGLARVKSGMLKRTYTGSGPALCPT